MAGTYFSLKIGSGKTSLVSRYHSGKFHNQQYPTVGVDFVNKNVYVEGSWVKLQIWDTVLILSLYLVWA